MEKGAQTVEPEVPVWLWGQLEGWASYPSGFLTRHWSTLSYPEDKAEPQAFPVFAEDVPRLHAWVGAFLLRYTSSPCRACSFSKNINEIIYIDTHTYILIIVCECGHACVLPVCGGQRNRLLLPTEGPLDLTQVIWLVWETPLPTESSHQCGVSETRSHSVAQASFFLFVAILLASASQVLRLQACAAIPGFHGRLLEQ